MAKIHLYKVLIKKKNDGERPYEFIFTRVNQPDARYIFDREVRLLEKTARYHRFHAHLTLEYKGELLAEHTIDTLNHAR